MSATPDENPWDRLNREKCEALGALPCPFCCGQPRIWQSGLWQVACSKCQCCSASAGTDTGAVAAWNRRTDTRAAVEAEIVAWLWTMAERQALSGQFMAGVDVSPAMAKALNIAAASIERGEHRRGK